MMKVKRNNRPLPAPVLAQELTAKVLAASNVALRRWEKRRSAEQPHDEHASSKCTSIREVEEWLASLEDIAENEELRKIHLAVEFLNKPADKQVKNICAVWGEQKQKKNGKKLKLTEFAAELTEKVLATSNAMKARRELMERTAHIGAAQPAHHTDVLADAEEHTMDQHEMTPRWMHPQPLSRAASLESPGRALLQAALQHPANLDTTQQGDWVFA